MSENIYKEKDSKLKASHVIDIVNVIEHELHNVGCSLKDYKVSFNPSGFDISNIKVVINDRNKVIDVVKEAFPEVRHELDKHPNKYVWLAVNVSISEHAISKFGLDYVAYVKEPSDKIFITVSEPKYEKPISKTTEIDDISNNILNIDQSDLENAELPYKEQPREELPNPQEIANKLPEEIQPEESKLSEFESELTEPEIPEEQPKRKGSEY
jgi:hypothetical protein